MKDAAFQELMSSVRQAGRIRRGTLKPDRTTVFKPEDIKAVRASLGASQSEFALMIGVSVATLQNWEQGRRTPDGPALALLRVGRSGERSGLVGRGQLTHPQESRDVLERHRAGQVADLVTPVVEPPGCPVDRADARARGDDVLQPSLPFAVHGRSPSAVVAVPVILILHDLY